jgi:uncharacterized protein
MIDLELARTWYPHSDAVHGFDHVVRVLRMAERLAREEGADLEIVQAAALLHDAEGSATAGGELGRLEHHQQSAEFARLVLSGLGWAEQRIAAVQHCILAHRFRDNRQRPETLEARILFDADKLDAIGAIGVARALGHAVLNGNPFYTRPSQRFLDTGELEPGEAHSAFHEYQFKLRKLSTRLFTPAAQRIASRRHAVMQVFFERLEEELSEDIS